MNIVYDCRFSTAQKLDKLGMRGSDTYDVSTYTLLPLSQIISRSGFSRNIDFTMHLDIIYISRCITKTMHLEKPKQLIIWDGGSITKKNWIRFQFNRYLICRCELVFENCFVPHENVLGEEGKGIIF